jgi:hypothetical protein
MLGQGRLGDALSDSGGVLSGSIDVKLPWNEIVCIVEETLLCAAVKRSPHCAPQQPEIRLGVAAL